MSDSTRSLDSTDSLKALQDAIPRDQPTVSNDEVAQSPELVTEPQQPVMPRNGFREVVPVFVEFEVAVPRLRPAGW